MEFFDYSGLARLGFGAYRWWVVLAVVFGSGMPAFEVDGSQSAARTQFPPGGSETVSGDAGNDCGSPDPDADGYYWWKGNLHTHTFWSDGHDYPEMVVDWYKQEGYHFLVLSDHNILSVGDKWLDMEGDLAQRGGGLEGFEDYRERFGNDWVETRKADETLRVRLKPLNEFRFFFQEPGRFLLMQGEEISDSIAHVGATNLIEFIPPQGGENAREQIESNIDAVVFQSEEAGRPMLPHLAHPNWRWRVNAEDMAPVENLRFFEVYNGHRSTRTYGDANHKSLERMWDIILTVRLGELGLDIVYGLAVDDAHNYRHSTSETAEPGRGWVKVRARKLTPEHLISSFEAGEFYASSGVKMREIDADDRGIHLEIKPEEGVTYTTEFIGTRQGYDPASAPVRDSEGNKLPVTRRYSEDIGVILDTVKGTSATYVCEGDEIYVRARVISSKDKENYYAPGEKEKAWIQPVAIRGKKE